MSIIQRLQDYLDENIPITREIGIQVAHYDQRGLTLTAPLAANKNDKDTAFGGSLAAVSTLSGWALTHMILDEMGIDANTVVRRSRIDYFKPVTSDIQVFCEMPEPHIVEQFKQDMSTKGKARWELHAYVQASHRLAVDFTGVYVVFTQKDERL